MAVYPICSHCSTRRDSCLDLSGHKKFTRWTADVHFSRNGERLRKTYTTKDHADIQERQWLTDYERGILLPKQSTISKTFNEVADEWVAMAIGQNRIKNFARSEQSRIKMFKELFNQRPIGSLTFKDGNEWLIKRMADGKAVNTINRDLKPLNWIMNYAVKMDYIKENPFKEIKNLKGGNIHERWLNQAEIAKLIESAENAGDYDLVDVIMVGINTGFRKGNLERLSIKDISNNRITASQTKSGKPYWVPIAPDLIPLLKRICVKNPVGPLLNTAKLDKRFREVSKSAGFYGKRGDVNNVTIHTLRHTFSALYLKRGGDLYKLSKLLGHSSITITEKVYAHLCSNEMDAQAPLLGTKTRPILESNQSQEIESLLS